MPISSLSSRCIRRRWTGPCASPYYYFPADYFRRLKEDLGDQLSLCIVRGAAGEILGGALLTECCGIVQYHLSGTLNSAIQLRPSKLMLDFARAWAKVRGNHAFHLGGGFGAKEDSVFEFKAGFSSCRHSFYTWQFIFSNDQYSRLEERRRGLDTECARTANSSRSIVANIIRPLDSLSIFDSQMNHRTRPALGRSTR